MRDPRQTNLSPEQMPLKALTLEPERFFVCEVANQAFRLQSAYICAFDTNKGKKKKLWDPGYTV